MKKVLHFTVLFSALLTSTLALAADIEISDAWVREAPPGTKVMAAYLSIYNASENTDTLTDISSNCCKFVEIHQSLIKDGKMEMRERKGLLLPPARSIDFTPGDLHVMLIKPRRRFRDGDNIELEFTFLHSAPVKINAPVKKATGAEHEHHSSH
jgi:hypothetical protein